MRVPIRIPPAGVNPIVVSTARPPATATRLAPLPRCAMTMRAGASAPSVHITCAYDSPWKP